MSMCDLSSATVFKLGHVGLKFTHVYEDRRLCPDSQTATVIDRKGSTVDAAHPSRVWCCVSVLLGDICDNVGDTHLFWTHGTSRQGGVKGTNIYLINNAINI